MTDREQAFKDLLRLHHEVDATAEVLHVEHRDALACARGCASCCRDEITVFPIEAARIRREASSVIQSERPHPAGACAFLDADDACRIYAQRPYVCRTQGLPLRWHDEHDGELVELRDICPLNDDGIDLMTLSADSCWTLGPIEGELAGLQLRFGAALDRVALRDLFVTPSQT